ncbi:MAG: hypothetical protein R6X27_00600, partial [Candidatus Desulfacyla sp.]
VAAVRLYDEQARTALCWIDPDAGTMEEFLALPSGGDTSYPGLVWHDGLLWVSYYASPDIEARWRRRLNGTGLKIGLVWAGNPGHKDDRNRSCPLHWLAPLSHIPGVKLYGLQKNGGGQSKETLRSLGIANLGEELTDFSVTAGIIANLDLIISVDTAVAHLVGAMGKPVWILLPFVPDWRWLMERDDTPWYPTMRLFRQEKAHDWQGVFQRVCHALREQIGG